MSAEARYALGVVGTPGAVVQCGSGDCEATELWIRDQRTGERRLLVRGHNAATMENVIGDITSPVMSEDGETVYFLSAAWAVSGALHCVDVRTKKERFMIDANSIEVVRTGPYRGCLLVDRHLIKYDDKGESLGRDSYLWLVSADGKPIREIGRSDDSAATLFRQSFGAAKEQGTTGKKRE